MINKVIMLSIAIKRDIIMSLMNIGSSSI